MCFSTAFLFWLASRKSKQTKEALFVAARLHGFPSLSNIDQKLEDTASSSTIDFHSRVTIPSLFNSVFVIHFFSCAGICARKRSRLEDLEESNTVGKLTDMIGRGKISVAAATELAQGVCADHKLPHAAIQAFASLGCGGQHPQNSERDLHRWVRNLYGIELEPYVLKLGLQIDSSKIQQVAVRVLAPHEIFHSITSMQSRFAFENIMLGNLSDSDRCDFWEHIKTLDPWATHPVLQSADPSRLIGFTIHGDGAVMKRDDECFVWSISSCLSSESEIKDPLLVKFPVAIIAERHMLSKQVP